MEILRQFTTVWNEFMLVYFVVLNLVSTLLLVLGWRGLSDYVRRRPMLDYRTISESEMTLPISIIVPAFNEESMLVESVRAMLRVRYPHVEVVVVNDGSADGTLARLIEAFDLVEVERVPRARLATSPVRGVYASPLEPNITVVDKVNGGKADAINAGLVYARYPLFCSVDADTMIDDGALVRLARPFQVQPETVGCGGVVRIVNGSTVQDSQVVEVRTPRRLLVNIQIVEYLRAFLAGRVGWSRLGGLLIISGAFGLFRREVVVDAGGYDRDTVGEDAELVVRLHRFCRDRRQPYRIVFVADPVCWTEAPGTLRLLNRQRDRWHRGLVQTLFKHRGMIGRRRYGVIGLVSMPYFILFEALGPAIELVGYATMALSFGFGWSSLPFALGFVALALAYGLVLSFGALLVEEHAFRRYRSWRCLGRLCVAALVENFGYRQLGAYVRAKALVTMARGRRRTWGEMTRTGYTVLPPDVPVGSATAPALVARSDAGLERDAA
jgi:cellulose synthase/poly-beta-1,6-N-acetylglucosamine synthase-like glycosyltransferase